MPYVRAPYLEEIEPFIWHGDYPIELPFLFRQTSFNHLLEVRHPCRIKVRWRGRNGLIKSGIWIAKPGMLLIAQSRRLSAWELKEIAKPPEEREISIPSRSGGLYVITIRRNSDIVSAARQYLYHISHSLVGKVGRENYPAGLGEYTRAKVWIEDLIRALSNLSQTLKPDSPKTIAANQLLFQTLTALSQTRQPTLIDALRKVERAANGKDRIIAIGQAIGVLGMFRQEKLQQMRGITNIGLAIYHMARKINQGANLIYFNSIPNLLTRLEPYAIQGKPAEPKVLLAIARDIENLYPRIQKVFTVEPYYARARSPQVKRLTQALKFAKANQPKKMYNMLARVHAKIEVLVISEGAIPEAAIRARNWLKRYSIS